MTKTLVCTIVTKNYLAYARALAVSLAAHNPGLELYVLLADRNDGEIDPDQESFHLIPLEALADQASVQRMCFYYTAFELCCALRGLLHEYILNHTDAERWIFLDSDIYVCGSLEPVFEQLRSAAILLTPHSQTPASIEQSVVCEVNNLIRCGLYNAGFLGLRRCETTRQFIDWWKTRLEHFCFDDLGNQDLRGLYVDQLWLNLVPLYFSEVVCLQDLGCNLGHWNLWARPLTLAKNGRILAGDHPLRFVHFSGWSLEDPERVSKNSPLYDQEEQPIWAKLGVAYRQLLLAQGHETVRHQSYGFSTFTDGELITTEMRLLYYEDWKSGAAGEKAPFDQPAIFQGRSLPPTTMPRVQAQLTAVSNWAGSLYQETQQLQQTLEQQQQEFAITYQTAVTLAAELEQLRQNHEGLLDRIRWMEQSRAWKLRQCWLWCKRKLRWSANSVD